MSSSEAPASASPIFEQIRNRFHAQHAPLLHAQLKDYAVRRPFEGIKILHNVPLTKSVILKIEVLLVSGADVTVTLPLFVDSDEEAIRLLLETCALNMRFARTPAEVLTHAPYDIVLDCCAENAHLNPRLGAVELTQTGGVLYSAGAKSASYAVVNVDDSTTKRLEDAIGSADGMMRAFAQEVPDLKFQGETFLLFGFGKVGVGIADRLSGAGGSVVVVDVREDVAGTVRALGHSFVLASDKAAVEDAARRCRLAMTATGVPGLVSANYDASAFAGKLLANMGTHDEWGPSFAEDAVMFRKRPLNFCLEEPTTIQYLDPAFFAHHAGAECLVPTSSSSSSKDGPCPLAAGVVHPLSKELDDKILKLWCDFHKRELPSYLSAV